MIWWFWVLAGEGLGGCRGGEARVGGGGGGGGGDEREGKGEGEGEGEGEGRGEALSLDEYKKKIALPVDGGGNQQLCTRGKEQSGAACGSNARGCGSKGCIDGRPQQALVGNSH